MSILLFILFGFVVGLLARAIMPGEQKMSVLSTLLLGMAGSFVGGFIGHLLSGGSRYGGDFFALRPSGIIGSILGALAILAIMGWIGRRRGTYAH